jgi:hypothetical protein
MAFLSNSMRPKKALGFCGGIIFVVLILSPILQAQSFTTQTIKTAAAPEDVIAADLNHDSLPDLIVLHRKAALISIILNQGNGKFAAPVTYSTDPGPISIDAVDMNGDGNLDLILGFSKMAAFSVYQGAGNGAFLPHREWDLPGWSASQSVTGNRDYATDQDGAQIMDVTLDNQIGFCDGDFIDEWFYTCGSAYQWTGAGHLTQGLVADFYNTGRHDIVFAQCCGTGSVPKSTLYLMTPQSTSIAFDAPVPITTMNQVQSLVSGDIRQDGNMGFMATFNGCSGSGCQGVMLFTGRGDGTFKQTMLEVPASIFDTPRSPQLIDYNADGLNDVAVLAHRRTGSGAPHDSLLIWTANTDGTYKPYVEINLGTNGLDSTNDAKSLFPVDLYGNGKLDLVVANPKGNSITILTNQSKQQQWLNQCYPRTDGPSVLTCTPVEGAVMNATALPLQCQLNGTVNNYCNFSVDGVDVDKIFSGYIYPERLDYLPLGKRLLAEDSMGTNGVLDRTLRHVTFFNPYLKSCPPGANRTVNFCIPASNGTAISPVRVLATGSSNLGVAATNIYIDDVLQYVGGPSVDMSFPLSNGTHSIVAQSWDNDGNFTATRTVNVTSQGCPLGALMTVNVCTPASGATVTSPVHFQAVANSDQPITGWRVYVPGINIFDTTETKLSIDLVLPKGSQSVIIKAWDSAGRIVGNVTRNITVQ